MTLRLRKDRPQNVLAQAAGRPKVGSARSLAATGLALATLLVLPAAGWADTVSLRNGTRYQGSYMGGDAHTITFKEDNGTIHRLEVNSVQRLEFSSPQAVAKDAAPAPAPVAKAASTPVEKVLPSGTTMIIRANEAIDSKTATEGQKFSAQVSQDVTDSSGAVVIPKGSNAELVIRNVTKGSAVGTADLVLDLDSVTVGGQNYSVSTTDVEQKGSEGIGKNKRTAEMVGGGAGLGALLGAIAGHGKGAALGAIIGAAAGGTAQVLTRGKEISVPAEAVLTFRLDQDLRLKAAS